KEEGDVRLRVTRRHAVVDDRHLRGRQIEVRNGEGLRRTRAGNRRRHLIGLSRERVARAARVALHAFRVEDLLDEDLRLGLWVVGLERPGELPTLADGHEELLRLTLLGHGRVLAEGRGSDPRALLVTPDASSILARHALDPETLGPNGEAE